MVSGQLTTQDRFSYHTGLHRHGHGQSRADSLDTGFPGSAYPEFLNYDVVEQPPEILWVCSGASGRLQEIRYRFLVDVWSLMFTACSLLLRSALPRRSVHPSSLTDVRAETARPSTSSESSADVPYRRPGLLPHLRSPPSSHPLGPCYVLAPRLRFLRIDLSINGLLLNQSSIFTWKQ